MNKPAEQTERRLPSPLIALTPGTLQRSRAGATDAVIAIMERAAHAAVAGGVRSLMVREPALEDGAFLELALRLRAILEGAWGANGAWLAVHDRLHLARAAGAHAVHLGGASLELEPARLVVGHSVAVGASSHAGDVPGDFVGVDYLLHAPVFEPTSKPLHGRDTLGWDGAESFAAESFAAESSGAESSGAMAGIPVYGLGGITIPSLAEAVAQDREHGGPRRLRGVALIGGLWGSDATPIDGMSRALTDTRAIHARAEELTSICLDAFGSPEAQPDPQPDATTGGPLG